MNSAGLMTKKSVLRWAEGAVFELHGTNCNISRVHMIVNTDFQSLR